MKTLCKLSDKFIRFWLCLFVPFVAVITAASALKSEEYELNMDVERLIYRNDHTLLLLILFFLLVALAALCSSFLKRSDSGVKLPDADKSGLLFVAAGAGFFSLFFLLVLRSQPYMDCKELISVASEFSRGDLSALSAPGHDSYLHIYAFQIGMVGILEILFRLFGEGNYFAFQMLNVFFAVLMACSIHKIAAAVLEDDLSLRLTDLLLIFCFPLYINVTFVYGDVIGWSLACCAILQVIRWIKDDRIIHLSAAAILIAFGILTKSNDYIFLIAIVIIITVESFRKKKRLSLLLAVICVAAPLILTSSVKSFYERRAGIDEFPPGAPASCWIAMSMIEHKDFEKGWYNGYNIGTFIDSGFDHDLADEIAKEKIRERVRLFAVHPKYTARFFLTKFISAWNDPGFNSQIKIEWSTRHVTDPYPLAVSMSEGVGRRILYHMMNVLHFIIFAGSLTWLVRCARKDDRRSRMTAYLILPVLGGMLFHLLWETQPRYMIPYYMLLFPAAASGILFLAEYLINQRRSGKLSI